MGRPQVLVRLLISIRIHVQSGIISITNTQNKKSYQH